MTNWKNIHLNFNDELQKEWEKENFNFEETQQWIKRGFQPNDYKLVSFVKNNLGYNSNESNVLDNLEIEMLKEIYQASLTEQSLLLTENLQEQEVINHSLLSEQTDDLQLQDALFASHYLSEKNETKEKELDMGWLTDDNIEYILQNDEVIKKAKANNVQIKTDIANIYLQIEKAKRGEKVDNDFWNSFDTKNKYIVLPLRVSGNHWSLLLLVNNEQTKEVSWIYYVSSLSLSVAQEEAQEIRSFLRQAGRRFGRQNNIIFNDKNLSEIIFQENPRQNNTWDCGVYLCLFIRFLSHNDYYNLNEENLKVTPRQIKEFRDKWSKEIGENNWCKWDYFISLKKDKEKPVKTDWRDKNPETERDSKDLIIRDLRETISQQEKELKRLRKENNGNLEIEERMKGTIDFRGEIIKDLEKKESVIQARLEEAIKETSQWNREKSELEQAIQTLTLSNASLQTELQRITRQNQNLQKQLLNFQKGELARKEIEFKNLVDDIKKKLSDEELLEDLLEAQKEFIQNHGNSFAERQLGKSRQKLLRKKEIEENELEALLLLQVEIIRLQKEGREKGENLVEIPPKTR